MKNPIPAFVLISLMSPLAAAQADLGAARLEVQRGRVVLLNDGRAERTLRSGESETTGGSSHLEIGTGSEVRLSWPGMASLHIWGPSSLRWFASPAKTAEGVGSLKWSITDLAWCDLEVRRGDHELQLPGDWTAQIKPGAVYLRGLPAGPVEMRLHAGEPIRLDWSGDASRARPPVMVNPGSSVRLERPGAAPVDKSSRAEAWDDSADWPYRKRSDSHAQRSQRIDLSRRTQRQDAWPMPKSDSRFGAETTRAKVSERPAPSRVTVDRDPFPQPEGVRPQPLNEQPKQVAGDGPESLKNPMPAEEILEIVKPPLGVRSESTVEEFFAAGEAKRLVAPRPPVQVQPQVQPQAVRKPLVAPGIELKSMPQAAPILEVESMPRVTSKAQVEPQMPGKPALEAEDQANRSQGSASTPVAGQESSPEPEVQPEELSFQPAQWQGLEQHELIDCGDFAIQRSPSVELRMFSEGRRKLLVDDNKDASVWIFTRQGDHRMSPGSVAVLAADGTVQIAFGKMDTIPAPSERAPLSSFAK